MKTVIKYLLSISFILAGTACSKDDSQNQTQPKVMLSTQQKNHIIQLYEEEKLAQNLYVQFYDKHGYKPFSHHSEAEARHMQAVADVLVQYELEVPENPEGVFNNKEYQKAYNEWLPKGMADGKDALYIAAYIEEMDILDLMDAIAQIAETDDIKNMYEQLLAGSENHLRAYNKFIFKELGITYQPQLMDKVLFDIIIAGGSGHGGQ